MLLPKPKPCRLDPVAPLGISFSSKPTEGFAEADLAPEIARLKTSLHTHPLIGSAVAQPAAQPNAPAAPARDRRRSSIGGDRAHVIAAQFEVSEPDDAMDEGYPESATEGDYIDDQSVDDPPTRR
jgi:hypothetical protein